MISTRRILAAACLAVGAAGLAVPQAGAAEADAHSEGKLNPIAVLDSLTVTDIPAEHKSLVPRPSEQLAEVNKLNQLNQLNELHQVTDLVAPVTNLVPAIGY
ncbi:hypothetical protein ACIQAC_17575 [Streptomyces sp. NPDC088387]|uniref:hypothetical protein n=1 Tax=Streptomyces sp. NPDC088387 TaxID=3365859 RepID=UPI0037F2A307